MWNWIKREFFHLLPVFIFFFVSFNLINMTDGLMMKREGGGTFSFGQILLAALVIAKIFLLVDHLSLVNAFSNKPLIYKVAWKTSLYFFVSFLARLEIVLTPYFQHAENPSVQSFIAHFNWPRFWAAQIWFLLLIGHFVLWRELIKVMGEKKIRKIFLGF